MRMDLCDGKYTIINELDKGGEFKALRYGKEWRNLVGDGLILALVQELEKANEKIKEYEDALEEFSVYASWTGDGMANIRLRLLGERAKETLLEGKRC